jgi:glutaconate CoA-transferase subunit B
VTGAPALPRERLVATIARLLEGVRHVAVGASSPMPAAGAMLLRARREAAGEKPLIVSILGSARHNFFTNGSAELFDCAGQGRVDAFFLGGGQIDGQANINLVGTGAYPASLVRWPGSFGSAYLYFVVPRVILFREEHSPRVLVERVDFVSAPGTSPPGIHRPGGPYALLTGMALFTFDRDKARFTLTAVHPGHTLADVRAATGFGFDVAPDLQVTPGPDPATLALLRSRVLDELAETYPAFAQQWQADLRREQALR